jgi:hypothetical protein
MTEKGHYGAPQNVLQLSTTLLLSDLADEDKDVGDAFPGIFRYNKNAPVSARARIDGMRIEPPHGTFPGP